MADRGLPPRPGEPTPGDVGKKGGGEPDRERPIDEPTELPGRDPEPRKGLGPQPTI
jgi:hypothetical protein